MLENGNKSTYQHFDNWIQDRAVFCNPVDMFGEDLAALVEEEASIFPVPKDEVIRVEELYKCSDLGDDVLGLNASSQRMHYNFGEFLTLEYQPIKTDRDVPDSNPNLTDDVEIFCGGILSAADAIFPQEKNNLSSSNEPDLVDSESMDDYTVAASVQVPDNMAIDEQHEAFRNMLGRETTVKDRQWLKNHLCCGSQNLLPLNDNPSNMVRPTSNQCSKIGWSFSNDVFKFKKKPRIQRVKRKCHTSRVSLKELSSEGDEDPKPESPEIEEDNVHAAVKRLRKPTRRYAEEIMEQDLRHQKRKCGASTAGDLKKQHYCKRFEAKRFICSSDIFNGECIQVPFGEPILSEPMEEKVHHFKACKKRSGLGTSNMDTEVKSVSIESQEDISEHDCNEEKMNNTHTRRKHHNYWSVSEVQNLIEGVSVYGVGKWTEIKKLMFNSSPKRTSVDLKDKWRNLLRASCSNSKRKRQIEQRKKHPRQIPQSILRRVKELAAIHPYPRTQPTRASETSCIPSPIPNSAQKICLPPSTAVRV